MVQPPYPMTLDGNLDAVPMERRVYFEVFGCQMNKLDAELMMEILFEAGYRLTHDPDEAGVILFNTCSVREHAVDRAVSRMGMLKKGRPRIPVS